MNGPAAPTSEVHAKVWAAVGHLWEPNAVFGHGVDHAHRVYAIGQRLAVAESADPLPIGAACYLMDAGLDLALGRRDHIARSLELARQICSDVPELDEVRELVYAAVLHHEADNPLPSGQPAEVLIVRDSDTLDRLGFTGIRMTLTYGTWIGRPLSHPDDPLCEHRAPELDGFSLDYVRHLESLVDAISTSPARELARHKQAEQDDFAARCVAHRERTGAFPDYSAAFRILEEGLARDRVSSEERH